MVAAWFSEVCRRTGRLVALWQCVGWCHGVLNTDNMSILGLTIDYGPYGFMDRWEGVGKALVLGLQRALCVTRQHLQYAFGQVR
jgi:uncharacterized protein YdiU (UPF0061 family)